MKKEYYLNKLNEATMKEEEYVKKSNQLSIGRLFSFLVALTLLIVWMIKESTLFGVSLLISIFLFIGLIIVHNQIWEKKEYYTLLIQTINEYLARIDHNWSAFSSTGKDGKTSEDFLEDLDIIGEISLFKYLNICKSRKAIAELKTRLSNPEPIDLPKRQQEMVEIASKVAFSLDFQVALKKYDEKSPRLNLSELLKSNQDSKLPKRYRWLMIGQLFLSITILMLALTKVISWKLWLSFFFIQLLTSLFYSYRFHSLFSDIYATLPALSLLKPLFNVIVNESFQNEQLKDYQEKIKKATDSLIKIQGLLSLDSIRKNFIGSLFNGLLPINLYIIDRYLDLIEKYSDYLIQSIEAIEDFEVIVSLSIIGQVQEQVVLPTLTNEMTLSFTNIKHPLLKEEECISNSLSLESNINIITGSNMSGKTSFLRTIGINLILMYAGAYVTADSFSAPYLKIFTSMRVKDDLVKGISTFYAELLRIKKAIDYAESGKATLVLIDEIFKGTNANDRITGALAMIERLHLPNVILFITTHDLEICQIEKIPVTNYHFSEHYEGKTIKFDYQLKKGICQTTNARYLMKLTGILRGEDDV